MKIKKKSKYNGCNVTGREMGMAPQATAVASSYVEGNVPANYVPVQNPRLDTMVIDFADEVKVDIQRVSSGVFSVPVDVELDFIDGLEMKLRQIGDFAIGYEEKEDKVILKLYQDQTEKNKVEIFKMLKTKIDSLTDEEIEKLLNDIKSL